MDLDDRMSLVLQLASCFLDFLSGVEGVSKSVEKVLVDPVRLKTVEKRCVRNLFLPISSSFYLPIQLSGDMFLPMSSAWTQGTSRRVHAQQSGGCITSLINKVLGWTPGCPPLFPRVVLPVCQGLWLPWCRASPASSILPGGGVRIWPRQ